MEFKDVYYSEPAKYWQPDRTKKLELDIVDNPDRYSQYIGGYKRDGEWSRVIWDGESVIIQSRSISKVTGEYGRKEDHVPHLVEAFKNLPPYTVLLGELCFPELELHSKDVGSILRCLPPKAIDRQKNHKLYFYCFDVLYWNGKDLFNEPFEERIKYFDQVVSNCNSEYVEKDEIKDIYTIVNEYQDYLDKGGEGMLLQLKTAKYVPGTRTAWASIKLKKATEELELPVIGTIEPNYYYTGKELDSWQYFNDAGEAITKRAYNMWMNGVVVNLNGVSISVTSGVTDDDAAWLATEEAQSAIADHRVYAVIQAMEIEKDSGSLRHPALVRLRTDL